MNAREELEAAALWLGFHHEDLSFGLRNAEDGLKLWRYWQANPGFPEFCDEGPEENERLVTECLGYNPWHRCADLIMEGDTA